jgi:chromosome segregation ATPase
MMQLFLLTLAAGSQLQENPIRRIVNLLQKMQTEVSAEQARDDDLNEKFACYCKTNDGALSESTAELREKIPQIEASIQEAEGLKEQLDAELAQHKEDRANAKASIDAATKQREKEAAAFADESSELSANIAACGKAIDAIAKGMAGSFLQSAAAGSLKRVLEQSTTMSRYERGVLTEFLSADQSYSPASGEIVGILKQLKENMESELDDATKEENAAIAEFEGLVAAKEKEIQAATEAVEAKTARVGDVAVDIVNKKNDLQDAQDSLDEDTKFLRELKKSCASEGTEYEERKGLRAQELVAISETIKILNDDDALDLFKKTLPSPALIQVQRSNSDLRQGALEALAKVKQPSTQLSFIALALQGKKAGFEKVLKMVDDMVVTLGQEQKDDDQQRDWCNKEFDVSEDNEKDTQRKIKNLETTIAETTDAIATVTDELAALAQKIKDLDTMVAAATSARKDEHALFVQTSAENHAALQLLEVAKNRLNKFYNPTIYKPPPKRELTEEERLYVASGGVLTTPAPGGIAGTGIAVFAQMRATMKDAPPPPP